jgi:hypothetical protein
MAIFVKRKSNLSDFLRKVEKTDTCWVWTGSKKPKGYGQFGVNYKVVTAHRYAYENFIGSIPDGMVVMHTCDNPPCVNPDHLKLGTVADNNKDRDEKGRTARTSGQAHGCSKLTDNDIITIRQDTRIQAEIAIEYGVSQTHISKIRSGKSWSHL